MADPRWEEVDSYFANQLIAPDPVLDAAIDRSAREGLPPHNVAANQGKLLQQLAVIQGARTILEIGTLGGYSTIWLGRALPADGKLITLELDPLCAAIARQNIEAAGLGSIVEIVQGAALDTLPALRERPEAPFDLIFIDADKRNSAAYFQWALAFSRLGTLIIADNVVREGNVTDPECADPSVIGIRALTEAVAAEPRVSATVVQTVGSKGYDGFMLMVVTGSEV
jgi:predicted O-methyltransferase YrrM